MYGVSGNTTQNKFPIPMGQGNCTSYRVDSKDADGNLVGSVISDPMFGCENAVVHDDSQINSAAFSGSWSVANNVSNYGGSSHTSTTAGDSFTFSSDIADAWLTTTGPHRGSAAIYIDGVYVQTVSTYSAAQHFRRIVWTKRWGTFLSGHSITIVNLATPGHPRIDVDGFAYLTDD